LIEPDLGLWSGSSPEFLVSDQKKDTPPPVKPAVVVDWRRLHLWQIQPIRDALVIAAIVGLVWLGNKISIVTVPMLLAILLAYLFEPLIRKVTASRHISRPGAALAIIVLAGVLIIVPLVLGVFMGVVQSASLVSNVAQNTGDLIKAVDQDAPEPERQAAYKRLDQGFWQWSSDWITKVRRERNEFLNHRALLNGAGVGAGAGEKKHEEPKPEGTPADGSQGSTGTETTAEDKGASSDPAAAAAQKQEQGNGQDAATTSEAKPEPSSDTASDTNDGEQAAAAQEPVHHDEHAHREQQDEYNFPVWKEQLYSVIDSSLRWLKANPDAVAKDIGKRALGSTAQVLAGVAGVMASLGFLLFTAFLTAFFFFFFSTSWGSVLEFWESLIPERRKGRVIDLAIQMDRVIAGFIRGRLTICFILSIYITIAYLLIGVPSAFLIGPLIGLLFLVPYIHAIGVPIAMVLMSLEPSGIAWQNTWWWITFAPIGVYMGAQFIDDYILSPTIQGKTTNMDTPTIVFASLAGGAVAGVYGLLIAIPVAACIKILFREVFVPRFREWANGKKPDILPIEN
jgi:predicted PurR-regulated permease PerM